MLAGDVICIWWLPQPSALHGACTGNHGESLWSVEESRDASWYRLTDWQASFPSGTPRAVLVGLSTTGCADIELLATRRVPCRSSQQKRDQGLEHDQGDGSWRLF